MTPMPAPSRRPRARSTTVSLDASGSVAGAAGSVTGTCSLAASDADTSTCPVTYKPTATAGSHKIKATYDEASSSLHALSTSSGTGHQGHRAHDVDQRRLPGVPGHQRGHSVHRHRERHRCRLQVRSRNGTVSFGRTGVGAGTFSGGATCTLVSDANPPIHTSTCSVTYTPTSVAGTHTVNATYDEASSALHASSTGSDTITISLRSTSTALNCAPLPAQIGQTVTCTATVTDTNVTGTKLNPQGQVTFTKDGGSADRARSPTFRHHGQVVVHCDVHDAHPAGLRDHRDVCRQPAACWERLRSRPRRVLRPEWRVRDRRWIHRAHGGDGPERTRRAKDNLGFVAKYKKGTTIPEGETEFQYKPATTQFPLASTSTAPRTTGSSFSGSRGQFQGSGTINGAGNYGFQVTVIDGGNTDTFRIKIWDKATMVVVFDSEPGQPDTWDPTVVTSGGNIVVHKT